ncbi:HCP-like protein [Gonapodya prolifera JEL478]|uniref:HCP-like protein n=1 Tax=Gonapodya prolifera (strain JEL478) TaxID=1344416 RepID=A0A139A7G6_GONPJ|nr:HCP-like protein [Gonapodya prolifera JEL478]|eukprot:KXS12751.1 HCP-like protein [Gonapodya prolifera JEL478]
MRREIPLFLVAITGILLAPYGGIVHALIADAQSLEDLGSGGDVPAIDGGAWLNLTDAIETLSSGSLVDQAIEILVDFAEEYDADPETFQLKLSFQSSAPDSETDSRVPRASPVTDSFASTLTGLNFGSTERLPEPFYVSDAFYLERDARLPDFEVGPLVPDRDHAMKFYPLGPPEDVASTDTALYASGIGAPRDQGKALLYTTFGALGGDEASEMALAYRYMVGLGIQKSCPESLYWYRRAAQRVISHYHKHGPLGPILPSDVIPLSALYGGVFGPGASGSDAPRAPSGSNAVTEADILQFWQYQAERGDPGTAVQLGRWHIDNGEPGDGRDPEQARGWFERAVGKEVVEEARLARVQEVEVGEPVDVTPPPVGRAGRRHPGEHQGAAAAELGAMYLRGRGVSQSNATARVYYEIFAQADMAVAIEVLGCFLLDGSAGYTRDRKTALSMWAWAAERGGISAMGRMGEWHFTKGEYLGAIKYVAPAAKGGHLPSMYLLGEMYADGLGMEKSCDLGTSFLKSVVERLHPLKEPLAATAQNLYLHGSLSTSYLWAEAAQVSVAWLIDRGAYAVPGSIGRELIPKGMSEWEVALAYWNRAATQGNADARVKVGDYYLRGWGLKPAEDRAEEKTTASKESQQEKTSASSGSTASKNKILSRPPGQQLISHTSSFAALMDEVTFLFSAGMFNLAWMYENGIGVEQDFHLAKWYYDRTLAVNPQSYLPVSLALTKLSLLSFSKPPSNPVSAQLPKDPHAKSPSGSSAISSGDEEGDYRWWKKEGARIERRVEWGLIVVLSGALMVLLRVRGQRLLARMAERTPPRSSNSATLPAQGAEPSPPPISDPMST